MPSGRICLGCGTLVVGLTGDRCAPCQPVHQAQTAERRRILGKGNGHKRLTARKRARDAIYKDPRWARARRAAIARDGGCVLCGVGYTLTVHHRVPVLDDPALVFDLDNLVTLCRRCHGRVDGGRANVKRNVSDARADRDVS